MKRTEFLLGSEGNMGGQGWEIHCNAFFVFAKQIFCWHLFLFNFEIITGVAIPKIGFKKDNFCRGIKLNYWRLIWNILWIHNVFGLQVEARTWNWLQGHAADMWLSKFCKKYYRPSDSVPGILELVPILRTWLGHGWDMAGSVPTKPRAKTDEWEKWMDYLMTVLTNWHNATASMLSEHQKTREINTYQLVCDLKPGWLTNVFWCWNRKVKGNGYPNV